MIAKAAGHKLFLAQDLLSRQCKAHIFHFKSLGLSISFHEMADYVFFDVVLRHDS